VTKPITARRLLAPALALAIVAFPSVAVAAAPKPFGHACRPQHGVRFCPTTTLKQRVPSFDGVPIDVDVTLPARGKRPWPTIALLHGYGGDKLGYGVGRVSTGFDNVGLARRGYAVLTISARGFGRSCGRPESRASRGCRRGWLHLADQRYEVRDTQVLLGKLVDQRIAKRRALGIAGGSYGGGQALQLAFLRNRVRLPNGRFAAWRSPKGRRLRLAAAYSIVPWSDLTNALLPNGKADFANPPGVQIQSYVNGLYVAGSALGFVAPGGADKSADLTTWKRITDAGEPYGRDAAAVMNELSRYHSASSLFKRTPSPLLMASGWTDDLFPPAHTLRVYDAVRARRPKAPVWLQLADFGHDRGGSHARDEATMNAEAFAFFRKYLKGRRSSLPPPGSVLAFGQSCPKDAPRGLGPFRAATYGDLSTRSATLRAAGTQIVASAGGDHELAKSLDPVLGTGANACSTYPAKVDQGTAVATAAAGPNGTTYLGVGRIRARVAAQGRFGQLGARLWDISGPDQTLVDRSVLRLTPNQQGDIAFDLHGNGYRFAPGHTIKLELVANDAPTHRASNEPFTIRVSSLKAALPTARVTRSR
jgi:cephalosporin-C deacetylase-like acetyl esterase